MMAKKAKKGIATWYGKYLDDKFSKVFVSFFISVKPVLDVF